MSTRITSDLWAVVPVKLLERTKRRLSPLLSSDEREALACAMLQDVLSALTRARSLAGLLVITGDAKAAAIAHTAGAVVLPDTENAGTTAAVTQAAQHLIRMGRSGMLVIPADLPSITSSDIDTIAAAHRSAPSVTLVPAIADGGTNALACSPPDAIPFCFGDDSLRRHRDAATRRAIEPQILMLERIGQDIDRPDDLAMFLARPSSTQTYACLVAHGIAERLKPETLSS
ncbi:MAG: 2-phospho-L-lactate/phosphoenolpyruvate guanylyltransferase [Betaproteobacteria bacterium]